MPDTETVERERAMLYFRMKMLQAEIEMNAMIAGNKECEVRGETPAFKEKDFMDLINRYGIHDNAFPIYRG